MSEKTEMRKEEKKAFELYDELAQIPKVSSGKLIQKTNSKPQISLKFTQTDGFFFFYLNFFSQR